MNVTNSISLDNPMIREISVNQMLGFLEDKTDEAQLLHELGYDKQDVRILLNEFIVHCYPSETMTFVSFCKFVSKIWPLKDRSYIANVNFTMLFTAFDTQRSFALTFKDVIIGLATMDENIISWAQSKCRSMTKWLIQTRNEYIFRYYDFNCDGHLDYFELLTLINDYATELEDLDQKPDIFKTIHDREEYVKDLLQEFGEKVISTGQMGITMDRLLLALKQSLADKLGAQWENDIHELQDVVFHLTFQINAVATKFFYKKLVTARSEHVSFCSQEEYI